MPTLDTKTHLYEEEQLGLIPSVLTRDDLNRLEQENIMQARTWSMRRYTLRSRHIFTQEFVLLLHKKMFNEVWRWAGFYRNSDKNIGVKHLLISTQIQQLLGDVGYWFKHKTYCPTELAIVFHHRLVKIHPFVNGNGRHARLFADIIVAKHDGKKLTWGRNWGSNPNISPANEIRKRYIEALRAADNRKYVDIITFAQS